MRLPRPKMRAGTALVIAVAVLGGTPVAEAAPGATHEHQISSPAPLSKSPAEAQLLWARLKGGLSPELYQNFDLFIYVNKAEEGPWAQHLYAFAKPRAQDPDADPIVMLDSVVSTGREKTERAKNGQRVSTSTPTGYFELDPERFETGHRSAQWQQEMPNSMFFEWRVNGVNTGLAIHGVTDRESIEALGHRASAGCIQLPLEASRRLMDLVRDNFEGPVPRFAFDAKTRTTVVTGDFARDAKGHIVTADGYRALLIIEDYQGGALTSQLATQSATHSG